MRLSGGRIDGCDLENPLRYKVRQSQPGQAFQEEEQKAGYSQFLQATLQITAVGHCIALLFSWADVGVRRPV